MQEYPPEVRSPPMLLAGLVGATQIHGRVTELLHESAAETTGGHRRLRYLSFSYDMRIPPCKRGGKDAPGYRVGGILKQRWLEKVCNTIPAVLVVCFDWSQDLSLDPTATAQVVAQLQHAQRQARDREIRLLVLAVLHASATDAEALCGPIRQQLEGTSSALIVAQGLTDLGSKAQKLERLVYQSAMSFYADEERRQKSWKPATAGLSVADQGAMQVRVSVKVGFLSEFRKDTRGALTSYIPAYQQLMHASDNGIADVIERMGLCNHISFRMYQLYLHSRDLPAAVHHCRIHTNTLRSCSDDADGIATWRKWHWLANNHHLFGELLEALAQQLPMLIDQTDMWQFPGFHYLAAAGYIRRLKRWVQEIAKEPARKPPGTGGDLVPAPFVGQREVLERPEECGSEAALEVDLRKAHMQLFEVDHTQQALQLLTRAQAAYKERKYHAGAAVCAARMAEEYLEEGNLLAASKLYERLRRERSEGEELSAGPWARWPLLRIHALERSVVCACRALGLREGPAVCERSLASLSGPGRGETEASAGPPEGVMAVGELRRQLLADGFEYLSAVNDGAGGGADAPAVASEAEQAQLLSVLRAALATDGGGGGDAAEAAAEVPLGLASAEVAFDEEGGEEGTCTLLVSLRTTLPVPLDLAGAVALTSRGEVQLAPAQGSEWASLTWSSGSALELSGALPADGGDTDSSAEERVVSLRLAWASAPSVAFSVRRLILKGRAGKLLPKLLSEPRLPSIRPRSDAAPSPETDMSAGGVVRPQRASLPLRAEAWMPVDPSSALVSELFVLHVVVVVDGAGQGLPLRSPASLWVSCSIQTQEDPDANKAGAQPAAFVLDATEGSNCWSMLPLEQQGKRIKAADLTADGELRPTGGVFAVEGTRLKGVSSFRPKGADKTSSVLVVPVVVRSGRDCRAVLSLRLEARAGAEGSGRLLHTTVLPNATLHFRAALQVSFDERAVATPGGRASVLPRRFSIKALTPVAVQLRRVEAVQFELGGDGPTLEPVPALGSLGKVAPGSLHVLALPPGTDKDLEAASVMSISFVRDGFTAAFFPWAAAGSGGAEPSIRGEPPQATTEWPIPKEAQAPVSETPYVELEHAPTGAVTEPLQVKVIVRGRTKFAQEVKVRVVQSDTGERSERFFISGPTGTQTILLGRNGDRQVCTTFTLVPLRSGMLTLPRAHLSAGEWEATSATSSGFAFSGGKADRSWS